MFMAAVVVILECFNSSFSVFRPQHSREIDIKRPTASDLNQDSEYIRHSNLLGNQCEPHFPNYISDIVI